MSLDDLADDAERQRNPFVEDLQGRDRQREISSRLRAWGPSFSAAAALATGVWAQRAAESRGRFEWVYRGE